MKNILLEQIVQDPKNRKAGGVDIIQSVGELGVLQPILVTEVDGKYQIVAGARRYASAKHFGLTDIPCIILESADVTIQAAENFDRKDLNPLDESAMIIALEKKGMSRDVVAGWLNISVQQVAKRERLSKLSPQMKDLVRRGQISASVAAELSVMSQDAQDNYIERSGQVSWVSEPHDLTLKEAREVARRFGAKDLRSCVPDLLLMVDMRGECCETCPKCEGSTDLTLFEETDTKMCHEPECFSKRLCEYVKRYKVPFLGDAHMMEISESKLDDTWSKIYSHERQNYQEVVTGIDLNGEECLYARGKVKEPAVEDETKEARKVFNPHVEEMNGILNEITDVIFHALINYYKNNIFDFTEIDLFSSYLTASHWDADLYMCDEQPTQFYKETEFETRKEQDHAKAVLFARAVLKAKVGNPIRWRKTTPHNFPFPPERDNALCKLAEEYVDGWSGSALRASHDLKWEMYVMEQWRMGNKLMKRLLNKAGNYSEKDGLNE